MLWVLDEQCDRFGLIMAGLARVLVLLMFGLALGVGYNAWPVARQAGFVVSSGTDPAILDVMSYVIGLLIGMILWQIGSVPWAALPERMHEYLASQVRFYQFIVVGGACVFVLLYY